MKSSIFKVRMTTGQKKGAEVRNSAGVPIGKVIEVDSINDELDWITIEFDEPQRFGISGNISINSTTQ